MSSPERDHDQGARKAHWRLSCLSVCLIYPLPSNKLPPKRCGFPVPCVRIQVGLSLAFLLLCEMLAGITELQSEGFTHMCLLGGGTARQGPLSPSSWPAHERALRGATAQASDNGPVGNVTPHLPTSFSQPGQIQGEENRPCFSITGEARICSHLLPSRNPPLAANYLYSLTCKICLPLPGPHNSSHYGIRL